MQHLLNASENWPHLSHINLSNYLINFQGIIILASKDKNALNKFVRKLKKVLVFGMKKVDLRILVHPVSLVIKKNGNNIKLKLKKR